jgi:KDO2-lipid IV(A) lauroyltransferase
MGLSRYRVLRLSAPVVGRTPLLAYPIAAISGAVAWRLRERDRKNLIRNMLVLCDGDRERALAQARLVFRNISRYWVDVTTIPHRDMRTFEQEHLTVVNPEHLAVLGQPGPVLIVSAHTGNAELALQAITHRGRKFTALVENVQPPEFAQLLLKLRSAAGGRFYTAGFGGVRACLQSLQAGEVVGMMADRDLQGTGLCTRLAGRKVRLPRGPWEIARRTNAVVLPVFSSRNWKDHLTVTAYEPFCVRHTDNVEADIRAAVDRWAVVLEERLKAEPGQWIVLEDFWRVHRCGQS